MNKTKTFMTTISGIVPILAIILGIIFIAFTGCDETGQMVGPVISGPADTEPTTPPTDAPTDTDPTPPTVVMGEVKQPNEPPSDTDPAEESEEPTVDTTPPTVVSVVYYRDAQMTQPVKKVTPEDPVFAKVTFSEPMLVKMGGESLPELRYEEREPGTGYFVHGAFRMVSRDRKLAPGNTKPLEGTTTFLCRYEIAQSAHQGIFRGIFRIKVSYKSVDLHGNRMQNFSDEEGLQVESRDIEMLEAYSRQLDTLPERTPPAITEFVIPEHLWDEEPEAKPDHFIGRVLVPGTRGNPRFTAKPTTGATITVMAGPQAGTQVETDPAGYYYIPTQEEELHLRVEKEWFEPKEVLVSADSATILANGDRPNYKDDLQQQPGTILIGQIWPDEVRFLLEEMTVVYDLLYIEAGPRVRETTFGAYSSGLVLLHDGVNHAIRVDVFVEEVIHAHQHAQVTPDGSGSIIFWEDTPEGQAFLMARARDWQEYGKTQGEFSEYGLDPIENAAAAGGLLLGKDTWGRFLGIRDLLIEKTPHRQAWAAEWLLKK